MRNKVLDRLVKKIENKTGDIVFNGNVLEVLSSMSEKELIEMEIQFDTSELNYLKLSQRLKNNKSKK